MKKLASLIILVMALSGCDWTTTTLLCTGMTQEINYLKADMAQERNDLNANINSLKNDNKKLKEADKRLELFKSMY